MREDVWLHLYQQRVFWKLYESQPCNTVLIQAEALHPENRNSYQSHTLKIRYFANLHIYIRMWQEILLIFLLLIMNHRKYTGRFPLICGFHGGSFPTSPSGCSTLSPWNCALEELLLQKEMLFLRRNPWLDTYHEQQFLSPFFLTNPLLTMAKNTRWTAAHWI